jgi:predicted unusual protein kinase regulating ubiquinone biosynthesis (AarF/ABC1/UbiB family)
VRIATTGLKEGTMIGNGKTLSTLAQGFRKRTLVTARLATKTGFKLLGKTLNPDGKPAEIDEAEAVSAAHELADTMSEMKGLIMKFGQMASYLEGSMPPAAQQVLAQLQAQSTPLSFEAASAVIETELGATPDALFDAFEREPFAAASLGQVHRAVLDGVPVAVKVQYPDIAKVLKSDLRTVGTLAKLGTLLSAVDGGGLVRELQERMNEECDYYAEAKNQKLFRKLLSDVDGASVPRVFEARSAERVLTTELSTARPFDEFNTNASQEAKNRAAAIIFEVCFGGIFRHCIFNADPHPGNYLFHDDGSVVFLDFGCVKRFDVAHIERWKRFARSILDEDRGAFRTSAVEMGIAREGRNFDWDYQWEMMRYVYRPYTETGFTFNTEYVRASYDRLMFKNPDRFKITMPPDALFQNRLQWGLYSVLSSLDAQADWGTMLRRAVDAPTEPIHDNAGGLS